MAARHGKILWNHGGACDAVADAGCGYVVSVLSPACDYLRDLPRLVRYRTGARRATALYAQRGTFGSSVRGGVEAGARAAEFEVVRAMAFDTPLRDPKALLSAALADRPDLLVVAGRFDDDVALIQERGVIETVGTVVCVVAGADAFHQELGTLAHGVMGPSQWEPHVYERPSIGPTSARFCAEFRRVFGRDPGYVAAQAYAVGIIIGECVRREDRIVAALLAR